MPNHLHGLSLGMGCPIVGIPSTLHHLTAGECRSARRPHRPLEPKGRSAGNARGVTLVIVDDSRLVQAVAVNDGGYRCLVPDAPTSIELLDIPHW